MTPRVLLIACGALAHEIIALRSLHQWQHLDVQCVPADLHNRPQEIPAAVKAKIDANRGRYARMFVAFADCGTGGRLDAMLEREGVERIAGAHCYEFYAGHDAFEAMALDEPGTLYLTDFLLRHFERLIVRGLGLDRHPELLPQYFGNYTRLVFLAQLAPDAATLAAAGAAADRLGLRLEVRHCGYGELETSLARAGRSEQVMQWRT